MKYRLATDNIAVFHDLIPNIEWNTYRQFKYALISADAYQSISSYFWQDCFNHQISVGFAPAHAFKALFFDLDGTILRSESLVEIARTVNMDAEIEAMTTAAMHGQAEFSTNFKQRLQLLRDVRAQHMQNLALPFYEGIEETLAQSKQHGMDIFLISSAIYPIVKRVGEMLGFDDYQGNRIKYLNGKLMLDEKSAIIDSEGKRRWVEEKCANLRISQKQVAVIGDGANDMRMMDFAQLAVGFQPKRVLLNCVNALNFSGDHRFIMPLIMDDLKFKAR
ncbi:MAG: HAD family phosphatase [Pseudomonadota bacterium]|nr:HAD family phosphatase [Pseudomonadota bacterium]